MAKLNVAANNSKTTTQAPKLGKLPTKEDIKKQEAATPAPAPAAKAAATPAVASKRTSHLKLVPDMIEAGKSDAEIVAALQKSFESRGDVTAHGQEWVNGRIKIYMNIGHKKVNAKRAFEAQAKAAAGTKLVGKSK